MMPKIVKSRRLGRSLTLMLLFVPGIARAQEQNTAPAQSSFQVTHVLGLEGLAGNVNGTLTIDSHALRFLHDANHAQIEMSSIEDVSIGLADKEVGGVPLALGRAATPYGGGRIIALIAHKKYDIVTVDYRDSDGGFHGAIFQLHKGEGQILKNKLEADGSGHGSIQNWEKKNENR